MLPRFNAMRLLRRSVLVPLTAVLALVAQVPAHSQELVLSRFQDYLESLRIQARIPGLSAVLVGRTDIIWERGFGHQDLERAVLARPDTPYHIDGMMQVLTAPLLLRCVEEGRLSLDDQVRRFLPDSPDSVLTLRQLLTHTSGSPDDPVFFYRPERLLPLGDAVRRCTERPFSESLASLFDRFAMVDSVPGAEVAALEASTTAFPTETALERYRGVLERRATPYHVDTRGRATPLRGPDAPLTAAGGVITTVRDLARFDLALKADALLRPETLALAWRPQTNLDGDPLPHAVGWFVQDYTRGRVVWQYGLSENGWSSLIMSAPQHWITLILLANSDSLVKPFSMNAGDLLTSPFGRLFLSSFVR